MANGNKLIDQKAIDTIIDSILKAVEAFKLLALSPRQLKKVLDDEALAVLAKYGYEEGENNGA